MKRFTLIVLYFLLIIRFDHHICKCDMTMQFKIYDVNHPLRQIAALLQHELVLVNKKIPNVNMGGCGVFAYELATMLNSIGVKTTALIIDEEDEYKYKKEILNDIVNNGKRIAYHPTSVNHVVLLIDELGVSVDVAGLHSLYFEGTTPFMWHGLRVVGNYTIPELKYAAYNSQWNPWFDRNYIPELKHHINLIKQKIEDKIETGEQETLKRLKRKRIFKQIVYAPVRWCKLYFS